MKRSLRIFFILWGMAILFLGYEAIGNFCLPESSTTALAASGADKSDNAGAGKGQLYVAVKPANADIKFLNIKDKFNQGIQLNPGQYRLEISAQDHKTEKYTVKIASDQITTINVLLPVDDKGILFYNKKGEFEDIYRTYGIGAPSDKNKGTDLGKQEAFIAALAFALADCSNVLPFSHFLAPDGSESSFKSDLLLKTNDLVYESSYYNRTFFNKKEGKEIQETHSATYIYYKNKRIYKFIEPSMKNPEFTVDEFPSWHDLLFRISGVNIVDITFSSDSDDLIPIPEGGAKITIEVPNTTLELIKCQTQNWRKAHKKFDGFKKSDIEELQKELDKLDFTDERDDAKSP